MKFDSKQTIEMVGVFAVVSSLLFVGMQLRLDGQIALADQYAFRAESFKSDYRSALESESNMSGLKAAWDRGDRPLWWNTELEEYVNSKEMDALELQSEILKATILYIHIDNLYFQSISGFLDKEVWATTESTWLKGVLKDPHSIPGNLFRYESREGEIERPVDSAVRRIISEIENES